MVSLYLLTYWGLISVGICAVSTNDHLLLYIIGLEPIMSREFRLIAPRRQPTSARENSMTSRQFILSAPIMEAKPPAVVAAICE
jgi:hypothetical protein